ncbi:MAG: HAD family phosphatase [Planctomycetota bacterium]|nr:HAD family phosphatase [Planctomycetota bacterium]
MNRRAVIFDMDGVLINSYRAHLEAWQRMGAKLGYPVTEDAFIPTFGRVNREIFHHLWGDALNDQEIERWGEWKETAYREIITERFPGMEGAVDLLDSLKAAGFALAIGSSGPPENVAAALLGLRRETLFDAIVNGREVKEGKPHPEVFLKAAEKLGIEPRRCAVIEDSLAGLEAAARAGTTPIGITGTFPRERLAEKAALVVDSLRELTPENIAELIDRKA